MAETDMTHDEMMDYLWDFYKLVYPGASGELEAHMTFPKSLVIAALKRLRYELAQKRVNEFTIDNARKMFEQHDGNHYNWEKFTTGDDTSNNP